MRNRCNLNYLSLVPGEDGLGRTLAGVLKFVMAFPWDPLPICQLPPPVRVLEGSSISQLWPFGLKLPTPHGPPFRLLRFNPPSANPNGVDWEEWRLPEPAGGLRLFRL